MPANINVAKKDIISQKNSLSRYLLFFKIDKVYHELVVLPALNVCHFSALTLLFARSSHFQKHKAYTEYFCSAIEIIVKKKITNFL